MEEIKTVIDRLKEKLEKLDNENSADLNSINEKQNSISSLNAEIDNLQKQIAARKENMAKLEAKRVEAESFDKSIEEVAPLIDKEEVKEEEPVVEETAPEETPVVEEAKEETVEPVEEETKEEIVPEQPVFNPTEETDNNMVFPFGDITADLETKEAPFEFKSNMSEFKEPEEEAPVEKEDEVPALEATMEPVQPEVSFTPANGPVFDERGFDISSTLNQTESPSNKLPDIGLNEMYNAPMEQESTRVLR